MAMLPVLGQDVARNKTATASSQETALLGPGNTVDGNATTRWSSLFSDPQWIQVDLGAVYAVNRVVLGWEAASARDFRVEVSVDGSAWNQIATRANLAAGARRDDLTGLAGNGRYVRVTGTARTTVYGYSLFDFEVYGTALPVFPGRLQAEDFKNGGQGVGYNDLTAGNTGGAYRTTDVDIATTTDAGGGFNVGWIAAGEWLAFDVHVTQAGSYTFTARVASQVAGTKTLRVEPAGAAQAPISFTSAAGWQSWVNAASGAVTLSAGVHQVRVFMVTGDFNLNWVEAAISSGSPGQLAFSSATYSLAENGGNSTVTVNRANGSIGTVTVAYATSNGTAAAGSDYTARSGTLTFAAGVLSQTFTVPVTDDASPEASETVNLTLSAPGGGATLASPSTAVLTITDNDNAFPTLPGRLQAEDFKNGGQGVGYNDLTAGNTGGVYRTTDVDIEATADAGGGFNVGWTAAGEWLAFDVNVTQAGAYDISARVASQVAGTKTLRVDVDGTPAATLNFTSAAGWQSWTTVTVGNVNLTAGNHTLRVNMVTGNFNLNWVEALRTGVNQAPIPEAGIDLTGIAGRLVTLDGRASRDPDNAPQALTYQWTQLSGPTVTLSGATTARPTFTPSATGAYVFRLQVGDGALTAADQVNVNILPHPGANGPLTSTRTVYAAPNLNYGYLSTPPIFYAGEFGTQIQAQGDYLDYHLFNNASYNTRTLDMSVFGTFGNDMFPPISVEATNVPVNGVFYRPSGNGPFPIAFFVHGNHVPVERSEPGYEEAAAHLASHGILTVSIDENYLNAGGTNGARAVLLLEHIKQFRTWNTTSGHPLFGRIDLNRIMLIGHSRGGEAVQHASFFNQLTRQGTTSIRPFPDVPEWAGMNAPVSVNGTGQFGPWQFNLQAVVALAPTEGQYQPVNPADQTQTIPQVVRDNFFIVHGSRDADVGRFFGQPAYDRHQPYNTATAVDTTPGIKGLLHLWNANHNFFNRIWAARPDGTGRCIGTTCYLPSLQLHRDDQYVSMKAWLGAIAQSTLLNQPAYLEVLRQKPLLAAVLPLAPRNEENVALATGFESQYQDRYRRIANHYQEDANLLTVSPLPAGLTGGNEILGFTGSELVMDNTSANWLMQETRGLKSVWASSGTRTYRTFFSDGLPLATGGGVPLTQVALRIGITPEETQNTAAQDFTVELRDFAGNAFSLPATDLFGSVPPLPFNNSYTAQERQFKPHVVVMQTLRFPLALFAQRGVAVDDIAEIRIRFDRTASGSAYLDDIQLTR